MALEDAFQVLLYNRRYINRFEHDNRRVCVFYFVCSICNINHIHMLNLMLYYIRLYQKR
jgi:hypothetical protein